MLYKVEKLLPLKIKQINKYRQIIDSQSNNYY